MEEVAGDAALLVDPFDVDAIATALSQLIDNRNLAARLGVAARERAGTYSWDRTAELMVAVYNEAAESVR
jgi:glycosyltransferase involved in cell wall biosynthesis